MRVEYNNHRNSFTPVVCLNGPVTLRTDDATKPMKSPPRRVPIAMQTKLRLELDGLADLKVITPVAKLTKWCSQISVQKKKNGGLRICIDPRSRIATTGNISITDHR